MESAFVRVWIPRHLNEAILKMQELQPSSFEVFVKNFIWILFYTLSGSSSVFLSLSPNQAILLPAARRKNYSSFQTQLLSGLQSFNRKLRAPCFVIVQLEKEHVFLEPQFGRISLKNQLKDPHFWTERWTVQARKWSHDPKWSPNWTTNDPRTGNDPRIIPQMIPIWIATNLAFFAIQKRHFMLEMV